MLDSYDLHIIKEYIDEGLTKIQQQITAEKYYNNEVDDVSINHDFFGLQVDEKINYLLGKEPTIDCEDKVLLDEFKKVIGKGFLYDFQFLGREASVKSIAWYQIYVNEKGQLKVLPIPSEECIPVWTDKRHVELDMMIRRFPITEYTESDKNEIWKVEIYTRDNVYYYEQKDGKLRIDSEKYLDIGSDIDFGHFADNNGNQFSFGRVPFVWVKNNSTEKSDLQKIKDLIDRYNTNRSRQDELLEQFKNFLAVITGYSNDEENEISIQDMLDKRLIFLDGDSDGRGSFDIVTPNIDTNANDSHNQTLKDDIILFGQSVDRNKMASGYSASGVALKMLYAGLDLKCNSLESEFNRMIDMLLWFIKYYIELTQNTTIPEETDIDIVFNRDISINESEAIDQCKNSIGVISNKTIVKNHPWVTDLEKELELINSQNTDELYTAKEALDNK